MTERVPVLCFPPAGAGPSFFQAWPDASPALRFAAVELPGKERRFAEEAGDHDDRAGRRDRR